MVAEVSPGATAVFKVESSVSEGMTGVSMSIASVVIGLGRKMSVAPGLRFVVTRRATPHALPSQMPLFVTRGEVSHGAR